MSETQEEIWRPIAGFEGRYEVSNMGRVKSLSRPVRARGGNRTIRERILRQTPQRYGHATVCLGRGCTRPVHRLVLEAFVGPCPEGMEALHGPAGSHVHTLDNLRWGTHLENMRDKWRDHTMYGGTRHHSAKLTEADVLKIRAAAADGWRHRTLAAQYGVDRSAITAIVNRVTWRHL